MASCRLISKSGNSNTLLYIKTKGVMSNSIKLAKPKKMKGTTASTKQVAANARNRRLVIWLILKDNYILFR